MNQNTPLRTIPLAPYRPNETPEVASRRFYDVMRQRRSVRMFSGQPVSRTVIENLVSTAGTAPSGANK